MNNFKKTICLILAAILLISLCPLVFASGLANFRKTNTYRPGQFTDIAEGVWWTENISAAYEFGLMKGNANGSFAPRGSISVIETMVIASRLHAIYWDTGESFVQGTPWYQVYVDYAENNGIVTPGRFANLKAPATRAEFADLLSRSMAEEALPAINDIPDNSIPDVSSNVYYTKPVYLLYRAGILTGSDKEGNFKPNNSITRAEAAAVLTRMADPQLRKSLTLIAPETDGVFTYSPNAEGTAYIISKCLSTASESVTIPAEVNGLPVTGIKGGAFAECEVLESINVDANNEHMYSVDGVVFTDSPVKTLVCFPPYYSKTSYYRIPDGVQVVAPYAFAGLRSLSSLTFPDSVTTLGEYAFTKTKTQVAVFVTESLTNIGSSILQGQLSNVPIYVPSWNCEMAKYCQKNNITHGLIAVTAPKETTISTSVPKHQTQNLIPTDESKVVYQYGYQAYEGLYDIGDIYQRYNLSEEEASTDGEVRLVLENSWPLLTPEKYQFKNVPAQSGLYGAGHTESAAILRAYDKDGTLIAMQNISGNFSFSFPDARSIGIEGGTNTGLTVIPIEPLFVQSPGSFAIDAEKCYLAEDGNVFQYFVIQFPGASMYLDFPDHLNFLGSVYFDCAEIGTYLTVSNHYMFVYCCTSDASFVDQMKAYALVFDGLETLIDNNEFSCTVGKNFDYSSDFGQKCYNLFESLKNTMVGNYYPKTEPINKIVIQADGSYPGAMDSVVYLDEYGVENFDRVTIIHEMVHAIDQSIATIGIAPSPWMEGRAEYITYKLCDRLGIQYWHFHDSFDWSYLTAEDKADFFRYFYFNTDRQNPYPIGYIFMKYICRTYGEDVPARITSNIAAVDYRVYNQDEATAALFKKCVEDATEPGVFQNFVRDVIG